MNNSEPIITNSDTNISGYVKNFPEGSLQDIIIKLMQKYRRQSLRNFLLLFLKLFELSHNDVKKILDQILPNNKYINGGKVATDSEYSYNVEDLEDQFPTLKDRVHTIDPERHLFNGCNHPNSNGDNAEPYLISCRTLDDKLPLHTDFFYNRSQYTPTSFREGYFIKRTGEKKGCGLIELLICVTGCDLIGAFEYIFKVLGIDISAPRVSQSQSLDGYQFTEYAESYSVPIEFHYDERIFKNVSLRHHNTSTGKLSFSVLNLHFKDEKISVFCTLQCNKATGKYSWNFIAPPDHFLNDDHYFALHNKSKNVDIDNVNQTHSKRIEELMQVDVKTNTLIWPVCRKAEIGCIIGTTGEGKTMVAMEIGIVAAGGGMIGQRLISQKARKVHYFSAEMSESQLGSRLTQIIGYHPNPKEISDNLKITSLPSLSKVLNLTKETDQRWFRDEIEDAEFVILDYLGLVISTSAMINVAEWDKFSTFARMLARKGVALLIVHQKNKQGISNGTSRITQDADFVITLKKPEICSAEETLIEFHIEKYRHARGKEHAPFVFKYTKENNQIQRSILPLNDDSSASEMPLVTREEIEKDKLSGLKIEMLQTARLTGAPIKAGMFKRVGSKGRSPSTVTAAFDDLCTINKLVANGTGSGTTYSLPITTQEGI